MWPLDYVAKLRTMMWPENMDDMAKWTMWRIRCVGVMDAIYMPMDNVPKGQ